jgi:hypothetical protein
MSFSKTADYRQIELDLLRHGGVTSTIDENKDVLRELANLRGDLCHGTALGAEHWGRIADDFQNHGRGIMGILCFRAPASRMS